jgi:hypothetical protein
MKALKNKTTGEIVRANGVDLMNDNIRLETGEMKPYPTLWENNKAEILSMNDKAIEYLAKTEEYKDFVIIEE